MKVLIKHLNGNILLNVSQEISNSELIKLLSKEINYPFELMLGFEYLSENSTLNLCQIISKYDVNIDEIVLIATEKRIKKNYEIGNEEYNTYITPINHRNQISKIFRYKIIGSIIGSNEGNVWGGKNKIFTDDSNISKAAVFEGLIKLGEQGIVHIKIIEKKNKYYGDNRNNIQTQNWGYWDGSYIFINDLNL